MPRSIEIYVRSVSADDAKTWLDAVFGGIEKTREEPALTFETVHEGEPIRVFVAEGVQGGDYTSIWLNGDTLPWDSIRACARAAHEALGREVICDPDGYEQNPWTIMRISDDGERLIDEREVDF